MASLAEKLAAKKAAAMQIAQDKQAEKEEVRQEISEAVAIQQAAIAAQTIKETPLAQAAPKDETPHGVVDLRPKIAELADLSGEDLTNAMKELKAALMHNPSAVSLMLPEDIGEMVAALRRITGQAITEATKPKKEKKAKALSLEEMNAAFDEL